MSKTKKKPTKTPKRAPKPEICFDRGVELPVNWGMILCRKCFNAECEKDGLWT